ncbi:MAG: GNAT family N-acetyltransferase [Pseudomonadota bacterium]
MRFLLDTNVLIPLEDSQLPLEPSLTSFVRLAHLHGHVLLYHPASEDDIREDRNVERRNQTLQRLGQYEQLDARPVCPWNVDGMRVNDSRDNEILYALSLNAANGLVTEDRGIHDKAKARGIANRVYTIQTANDQLLRLHRQVVVALPNVTEVPLYSLTPQLSSTFFDSLRDAYPFDEWFAQKAQAGVRAWISNDETGQVGAICIYDRQTRERITDNLVLPGAALKLSTFKVGETHRGRKIGELFLKAAFRYATEHGLEHIFIHGDMDKHHFLFDLLVDFGFERVGSHPGSNGRDAVYLKQHPMLPPAPHASYLEYHRKYFPHFFSGPEVAKFVVPIRPEFHRILFPDYQSVVDQQADMFPVDNYAGNAIKMAYLSHAQTNAIEPGSVLLFYRSSDDQALTSIGIVESYEQLSDADAIVQKVKRRTVYTLSDIQKMAVKPTRVLLFRFVRHFVRPIPCAELIQHRVLNGSPQSLTSISHDAFQSVIAIGG